MDIVSPVFEKGGNIPEKYSCDGKDINPPLEISDVPAGAESLALVMDDPDAPGGTFTHWVAWNIPPDTEKINEGEGPDFPQGKNDFGRSGYGGPCPPRGTHRYYIKIFALDTTLDLGQDTDKARLESAMEGHVASKAMIIGKYTR